MADTTNTSSGSSVYRIPPLRGSENYTTWRIQMEDILTALDLYGYAIGTKTMPAPVERRITITPPKDAAGKQPPDEEEISIDTTDQDAWLKADREALSHIRLRVDAHSLTHIQACTRSAEAWDLLSSTFQVQGTVGLIDLQRKFFSHRMTESEDVEEHICKMREWYQQINNIAPNSISEIDWITTLVASLPDTWDSFTQSIDFNFEQTDRNKQANQIADLRARIMAEAHRCPTRNDTNAAFFNTKPQNNRFMQAKFKPCAPARSPDKSNSKCNNCSRVGHWAAECRQPGGGAYKGASQSPRGGAGNANKRFSNNARHKGRDNRAHIATDAEPTPENFTFSGVDNEIATLNYPRDTCVADSGTTTHIANNRGMFTDYRTTTGCVTGVAGKEPIVGRGTILLKCLTNPRASDYGYYIYHLTQRRSRAKLPDQFDQLINRN